MSHADVRPSSDGTQTTAPSASPPIEPLPARATLAVVAEVLVPLVARGLIIRRRRALRALAMWDADRRAVERLLEVRAVHGPGPALLRLPLRNLAVVLTAGDARHVLDASPEPFTPANREKRAALSRFEPHGVLISPAPERAPRRAFNERALETGRPVHSYGDALIGHVRAEADALLGHAFAGGELAWPEFHQSFDRIVRGVVLGDAAVADEELTEQLNRLRRDANWGYLLPKRRALRRRFLERLRTYLERPDPAALSGHIATMSGVGPQAIEQAVDQVPQWLFAFDAAAIVCFATLALLATHGEALRRARAESRLSIGPNAGAAAEASPPELPFLRACVLEVLRLWPTTPALLRDTTAETGWPAGRLPRRSATLIFAPLFHRAVTLQPHADTFAPERWLEPEDQGAGTNDPSATLIPFSAGAGRCPGRELVLLISSQLVARLLAQAEFALDGPLAGRLQPERPLPSTLDHFRLAFRVRPRSHVGHRHYQRTDI